MDASNGPGQQSTNSTSMKKKRADSMMLDLDSMKGGSNIHQLYQDLFLKDMKDEIVEAQK